MSDGLREAYRHQLIALRALRRQIAREDRMVREIMDAVRDSDEAQTSFGHDCGILNPPSDAPIAQGLECKTHAFAAIRCSGGVCAEAMDALDEDSAK